MIVATVEVFRIGGIRLVSDEKEDARKTKKMKIEEKSGKRGSYIAGGREGSETAANFVRRCWEPGVVEMVCEEVKCDHLVSLLSISADERESGGILNKREEEEQKRDRQQMPAVWLKTAQNSSKQLKTTKQICQSTISSFHAFQIMATSARSAGSPSPFRS